MDDATRDDCALYALGLLEGEALERFLARLAQGDDAITAELSTLEGLVPWIGLTAPRLAPSPDLKRRLFSRIGADDFYFLMADEDGWIDDGTPGVSRRVLFVDPADRSSTLLLRITAGTRHAAPAGAMGESVYVVEGGVTIDGEPLSAGDWRPLPGTAHAIDSAAGAVLFTVIPGEAARAPAAPPGAGATVHSHAIDWHELGGGASVRPLGRDRGRRCDLVLVRVSGGGTFPEHTHGGVEELYVLEGSCECQGRHLERGDYHRAPAASHHDVTPTATGCIALVLSRDAA